ncbi:ArsR/SmtB family transcription factor [Glycomyces arizonensis]|uniref:ArsR/SmtB family transcription factor n=1 Tax=Glycomyces arizonensis TaxID=256035 RepID=UPI0003FC2660|nr:metalloregulator ArsR/SmtB family transcription factor [Glycomyces arizonensis]
MDDVFKALADPVRRRLLDRLNERNGLSLRELCEGLAMARQSVSKHLGILEAAGLVTAARRGREKLHYLNAAPINAIADRWISRYDRERARALADLKTALEEQTVETTTAFVYVTHVKTTPERLWRALTEPEFTKRYWGVALDTDWRPGSTMTWVENGVKTAHPDQRVLECDPPRRLSYTWHTFTPEWAANAGVDEDALAAIAAEPRSKVTFELEPAGEAVKLTVTHDGFAPGSTVRDMIGQGWPQLLSSMKTLLETGEPL